MTPEQISLHNARCLERYHDPKKRPILLAQAAAYRERNREKLRLQSRERAHRERYTNRLLTKVRARAKKKRVPFALALTDLPSMPVVCPVLGISLVFTRESAHPYSPSLDRIVPALGYVPGNVRFISNRANTLKSDGTLDEMRRIVQDLEHHGR